MIGLDLIEIARVERALERRPRLAERLFRPGELAYAGEDMLPTPHDSIRIWKTRPPDAAHVRQIVATFDRLRNRDPQHPWSTASRDAVVTALRAAVPEMVASAAAG